MFVNHDATWYNSDSLRMYNVHIIHATGTAIKETEI